MDVIERWLSRSRKWLAAAYSPAGAERPQLLSREAYDLLRQVERGLELRKHCDVRPEPRDRPDMLQDVKSLSPISSGLSSARRALGRRARARPAGSTVEDET
jgi:hypothetical protein